MTIRHNLPVIKLGASRMRLQWGDPIQVKIYSRRKFYNGLCKGAINRTPKGQAERPVPFPNCVTRSNVQWALDVVKECNR